MINIIIIILHIIIVFAAAKKKLGCHRFKDGGHMVQL